MAMALQARSAEAVDGGAGHRDRQAAQNHDDAADVETLLPVRLAATENQVVDFGGVELRGFAQHIFHAMRGEILGPRDIERSAQRLWRGRCGSWRR